MLSIASREGPVASGRDAARAWLDGSFVLGIHFIYIKIMLAGATFYKRLSKRVPSRCAGLAGGSVAGRIHVNGVPARPDLARPGSDAPDGATKALGRSLRRPYQIEKLVKPSFDQSRTVPSSTSVQWRGSQLWPLKSAQEKISRCGMNVPF